MRSWPLLVAILPVLAGADEVYLKGGGRLSGQIVQKTATVVEVDVGAGRVSVPADRVEKIVEGQSALMDYYERARVLKPGDVEGWRALGDWASAHGLGSQAREAYEKALVLAPADPQLNAALGREQVNGQWMSEEEAYRAKGFVKFQGQWMTPAEQSTIMAEEQAVHAESRARDAEARAATAEQEARDAQAKQQEAEAQQQEGLPLWYGWAGGPTVWPSTVVAPVRPTNLPARRGR